MGLGAWVIGSQGGGNWGALVSSSQSFPSSHSLSSAPSMESTCLGKISRCNWALRGRRTQPWCGRASMTGLQGQLGGRARGTAPLKMTPSLSRSPAPAETGLWDLWQGIQPDSWASLYERPVVLGHGSRADLLSSLPCLLGLDSSFSPSFLTASPSLFCRLRRAPQSWGWRDYSRWCLGPWWDSLPLFFFFFFKVLVCFCPHPVACGITVPRPGTELAPCWVEVQCLNHWTTREEREVAQLCPTLCDSMDCSPQGPPSMGFFRQEYWNTRNTGILGKSLLNSLSQPQESELSASLSLRPRRPDSSSLL